MDNVGFKKRTLCAADPRSRKATISSFFKSLALLRFLFLRLLSNLFATFISRGTRRPQSRQRDVIRRRRCRHFLVTRGNVRNACGGSANGAFLSRKVSNKNSSFTRARVFSLRFFFAFFFLVSRCVCPLVACGYCFFRVFGPRRKSATHRPKDVSNILSKVSPHNLASHHHRYQTHEKSFHAFQREREFRCAEQQQQQQQRLLFHRLCFFFKYRFIARARVYNIYICVVLVLITRRMALLFPMWW